MQSKINERVVIDHYSTVLVRLGVDALIKSPDLWSRDFTRDPTPNHTK